VWVLFLRHFVQRASTESPMDRVLFDIGFPCLGWPCPVGGSGYNQAPGHAWQ